MCPHRPFPAGSGCNASEEDDCDRPGGPSRGLVGFAKPFGCDKVAGEEQAGSIQSRPLTIGGTPILSGGAHVPDLQT